MPAHGRRVLILAGYFDWFSGYQETVLANWIRRYAEVNVIASDRVSPAFNDEHLATLSVPRRYRPGSAAENGVEVTRLAVREMRSMVWSNAARGIIAEGDYDLVVQVMPGQGLPMAATFAHTNAVRAVLYGDNSGMWSHLSRQQRAVKGIAFAVSKGVGYALTNRAADLVYAYTPDTVTRLHPFRAGKTMKVLPLAFDPDRFNFDPQLRARERRRFGYSDTDIVIVSAGRFMARKRLDALVSAFKTLRSCNSRLRLHLAGADQGPYSRELRAQVSCDPDLAPYVQVSDFMDSRQLNAFFNAADIGVWPMLPAVTIQQAMGTGLPVALPMNSFVGHLIRGGSGCYFEWDTGDSGIREVERAIRKLLDEHGYATRKTRAEGNAWLGGDRVALSMLADAGILDGDIRHNGGLSSVR